MSLAIFDDRVEVWSAGKFPIGITPESLSHAHLSVQRNPILAEVFYRAGLIEKWGRGTNRVAEMCRVAGIVPPEFEEITGAAVVTFRVPVAQVLQGDRGGLDADRGGLDLEVRRLVDGLGVRPRKAVLREAILALASLRAWRPAELAEVLGVNPGKLTERHLKEMVEQGLLERVHPETPAHPAQAYRASRRR